MKLAERILYKRLYEALCKGCVLTGASKRNQVLSKKRTVQTYDIGRGAIDWSLVDASQRETIERDPCLWGPYLRGQFQTQKAVYASTSVELALLYATVRCSSSNPWLWYWDSFFKRFGILPMSRGLRFTAGCIAIFPARHFCSQHGGPICSSLRSIKPREVLRVPPSMVRNLIRRGIIKKIDFTI